jgi:hypothetical protein
LPKLLYLQPIGDALYDALVSINVPSDKARAVVDAMERDMGMTLATKQDLEVMKLATRQDFEKVSLATKQDLVLLRQELKQDVELLRQELRQDIQLLRQEMDSRFTLVDQRFDALRSDMARDFTAQRQSIVIQLGSVIVICFGLALAIVRIWI